MSTSMPNRHLPERQHDPRHASASAEEAEWTPPHRINPLWAINIGLGVFCAIAAAAMILS